MRNILPKLYVIVPCFNEENVISHTLEKLSQKLYMMIESAQIAPQSAIVLVDDGSSDNTWQHIQHSISLLRRPR